MPRKAWEHGQENRRFCWKPIKVYKEKKRVFIYEFFFLGICQGLYTQRFLGVARRPRPRVLEVSKERLKRKRNY